MTYCAYCRQQKKLTREHIVPSWYSSISNDMDIFNVRSPLTHRKGDPVVKDVCEKCNNEYLSILDSYGKELYKKYFKKVVYKNEFVNFQYDKNLLVRWLLKIAYNGARSANADSLILSEFREQIIGTKRLTGKICIFLDLIAPTKTGVEVGPASIDDAEEEKNLLMPKWFRLCQIRLPDRAFSQLVQRQVIINSFAFTIFAASLELKSSESILEDACSYLKQIFPETTRIDLLDEVSITPGNLHTLKSYEQTISQYPVRFDRYSTHGVEEIHAGKIDLLLVFITRDLIEDSNVDFMSNQLEKMVLNKESATAYVQRIEIVIDGFDEDKRELWEIPKVREYLINLVLACPYIMFLTFPHGSTLKILFNSWVYEKEISRADQAEKASEFLNLTLSSLNETIYRFGLSSELCNKITNDARSVLFGGQDK